MGKKKLVKGLDYMNKRNGVSKHRKSVIFKIVFPKGRGMDNSTDPKKSL